MTTDTMDFSDLDDDETIVSVDTTSYGRGSDIDMGSVGGKDVYTSDDGEESSDDVDPRLLFRTPTVDEVRWYYRQTSLAPTIVNKPVKDAFKNGYTVKNDPTGKVDAFLDDYVDYLKTCEIKSRRDGFCVLYWVLDDDAESSEEPSNVRGVSNYRVLTLDQLSEEISSKKVEEATDFDKDQFTVRDTGVVVVSDIESPRYGERLGYGIQDEEGRTGFVHESRTQHFAWNEHVDGDVGVETYGDIEGDSVLVNVLNLLKALAKSNWAIGQTLFKYSAPLHAVTAAEGTSQEKFEDLRDQVEGLNAASDVTLPPDTELETHGVDSEIDPSPYIESLIQQVCAGTEMTKSVLMGTQTGTVSGSETDVKNYFNQVQRYRQGRGRDRLREAVDMAFGFDQSIIPSFALGYEIEFNPLFRLDSLDRMESMVRVTTAVTNAINNYVLTPQEAREIVEMEWAELEIDVDLEDLTETQWDELDRINLNSVGAYEGGQAAEEDQEADGNPRVGNTNSSGEGGMSEGQSTAAADPTSS